MAHVNGTFYRNSRLLLAFTHHRSRGRLFMIFPPQNISIVSLFGMEIFIKNDDRDTV